MSTITIVQREANDLMRSLDAESVQVIVADPPYGIAYLERSMPVRLVDSMPIRLVDRTRSRNYRATAWISLTSIRPRVDSKHWGRS